MMIGLFFMSLLGCSHAAATPKFTISGYSRSSAPEMTVTFENGKTYEMILEPYSESPCNFIGELKNEPGSAVGVTGCLNNPGDKMYITLPLMFVLLYVKKLVKTTSTLNFVTYLYIHCQ